MHGRAVQNFGASCRRRAVFMEKKSFVLRRNQEAGGNGVATDARTGKVRGKPLRKVRNACLSRRIRGNLGQGGIGIHRRDIEHRATCASEHICHKHLAGNEHTLEVEIKNKIEEENEI